MTHREKLTAERLVFDDTVSRELWDELRLLYSWITEAGEFLENSDQPVNALEIIRMLQKTPNELYAFFGYQRLPRLNEYLKQLEDGVETWVQ